MSKASFEVIRGELIGANKYMALDALSLAEKAHEGVFRKDGVTPYIEHPVQIAGVLLKLGIDKDEILSVALLHDVLEDCEDENLKAKIHNDFPSIVSDAVKLLSKPKNYNNDTYYAGIKTNPIAILVKLADRAHNLSTLYNFSEEKKIKYITETKEYIYPLIKYAQHTYYRYIGAFRIFDLWIESIVKNIEPYIGRIESISIGGKNVKL